MTVRDNLAIAFDRDELRERFEMFRASAVSDAQFQAVCPVKDYRKWSMSAARRNVRADKKWEKRMEVVNYRPFDKRWIFYSSDIITYPNFRVMDQFKRKNLGLISSRIHKGEEHAHEFVTREMMEIIFLSSKSSNNAFLFPLYTFESDGDLALEEGGAPNFSRPFLKQLCTNLGLRLQPSSGLPVGLAPEDIFHYAYAVLHSPGYRSRYAELLKIDFPRLPLTGNLELFRALARLGGELTALHLLESPRLAQPLTKFIDGRNPEVEKVSWSRDTVWVDKAQTTGFRGVREAVWHFHIGGYQVCEKWLKDRKGRPLTKDDIAHYHKIVVALSETIRLMAEIDEVIEKHGGWPGAFSTSKETAPDAQGRAEANQNDESPPIQQSFL
jgi:predicted helicase